MPSSTSRRSDRRHDNDSSDSGLDHEDEEARYDNPLSHAHRHDESFTRANVDASQIGIETGASRRSRQRRGDEGESEESELDNSTSSEDEEDRALERELWDDEERVGGGGGGGVKDRVMQSLGKGRYAAVQAYESRRDRSSRSAGPGDDRNTEDVSNSLGTFTESVRSKFRFPSRGGSANFHGYDNNKATSGAGYGTSDFGPSSTSSPGSRSHLRKLSLNGSNPDPAYFNQHQTPYPPPRRRIQHWPWIVCGVLFGMIVLSVIAVVIAAAVKGGGNVEAGFKNMTDEAAKAAGFPVTGTDSEGRTLYSMPFSGNGEADKTSSAQATSSNSGTGSQGLASAAAGTTGAPIVADNSLEWKTLRGHTLDGADQSHTLDTSLATGPLASASTLDWQQQSLSAPSSTASLVPGQWYPSLESVATQAASALSSSAAVPEVTRPITTLTWASETRTIAAGGPLDAWQTLAMSAQGSLAPAVASPAPSLGAWSAPPIPLPLPLPSLSPEARPELRSDHWMTNFSMAKAPEAFQTYTGPASLLHANGQLGPCGISGNDTDYLVALPSSIYLSSLRAGSQVESTYCGAQVLVTSAKDGRTVTATVAGSCTQCESEQSLALSMAVYHTLEFSTRTKEAPPALMWGFIGENKLADSGVSTVLTAASAQPTGPARHGREGDDEGDDKDDSSWLPW